MTDLSPLRKQRLPLLLKPKSCSYNTTYLKFSLPKKQLHVIPDSFNAPMTHFSFKKLNELSRLIFLTDSLYHFFSFHSYHNIAINYCLCLLQSLRQSPSFSISPTDHLSSLVIQLLPMRFF